MPVTIKKTAGVPRASTPNVAKVKLTAKTNRPKPARESLGHIAGGIVDTLIDAG